MYVRVQFGYSEFYLFPVLLLFISFVYLATFLAFSSHTLASDAWIEFSVPTNRKKPTSTMDSEGNSTKQSNRNRFSLILQTRTPLDVVSSSDRGLKSKRSMPLMGDSSTPTQISSTKANRRRSSTLSPGTPTFSSFLRSIKTPVVPEYPISPQETSPTTKLPKKARGLSEVLSQMAAPHTLIADMDGDEVDIPPELAAVKEVPFASPLPSPRRRLSRSASASATSHMQRVKSFVLPHPTLPEIPARKLKPRYERAASVMLTPTKANRPGSISVSSPSGAEFSQLSANSVQPEPSLALDSVSSLEHSTPTISTTELNATVKAKQRRRMSFDFVSLTQPLFTPKSPGLTRSRTLWGSPTSQTGGEVENLENFDRRELLPERMNERQRTLNVKRARKMTQVSRRKPLAQARMLNYTLN